MHRLMRRALPWAFLVFAVLGVAMTLLEIVNG